MLRISEVAAPEHTTLRLEGRVVDRWVGELGRVCRTALERGVEVALDLRDVSFVDERGTQLLRLLRQQRVALLHCSPFVASQIGD